MIPALPAPVAVLRNARLADGAVVDVRLDGPVVAAVEPVGGVELGARPNQGLGDVAAPELPEPTRRARVAHHEVGGVGHP